MGLKLGIFLEDYKNTKNENFLDDIYTFFDLNIFNNDLMHNKYY